MSKDMFTRFDRRLASIMAEIEYAERPAEKQKAGPVLDLGHLERILHYLKVNNPDLKGSRLPLTTEEAMTLWVIDEDGPENMAEYSSVPLPLRLQRFFHMPRRRYVGLAPRKPRQGKEMDKSDPFISYLADRKAVASAAFDLFPTASGQEES